MHKKSPRHLSRSLSVQALYYYKKNQTSITEIEAYLKYNNEDLFNKANYELMHFLIENGANNFDTLLNLYVGYFERDIEMIDLTEQTILVIAAVELQENLTVPAKVVINEAVELTKLYGANDSYKFVNGLVDKLAKKLRPQEKLN